MRDHTVEQLLAELGQELPLGNSEMHRRTVVRAVYYLLRRIGYDLTARFAVEPFSVENHVISLPEYVIDVQDAGPSETRMCGHKLPQGVFHSPNPYAFQVERDDKLRFPNLLNGTVYLEINHLPHDEQDEPLIMRDSYEACYSYCLGKLLGGFPLHPRFSERVVLEQSGLALANETRGVLNRRGRQAENRTERHYKQ